MESENSSVERHKTGGLAVGPQGPILARSVLGGTVVGLVVGGPLIGLMGFSFLASVTLMLVTSPLLLIFSPLLLGAALVFAVVVAGFGVAAVVAVVGMSALGWVFRELGTHTRFLPTVIYQPKERAGYHSA